MSETNWTPQRKVVAAAAATVLVGLAQVFGLDIPLGVEGAMAVLAGYWMPNSPNEG